MSQRKKKQQSQDMRGVTRLLAIFAIGLLLVIAHERQLGLSPGAIDTLGDLFSGLLSLAAISFSHYSCRG